MKYKVVFKNEEGDVNSHIIEDVSSVHYSVEDNAVVFYGEGNNIRAIVNMDECVYVACIQ